MVEILLAHGANIHAKNKSLIERGADLNCKNNAIAILVVLH